MSSSDATSQVKPPFGPPDCPWIELSGNSPVPEAAVYQNGKLNGDKVYIGRVCDGKSLFIGTIIPRKGHCFYLNKNSELKSSSNYEILTVDCGDPLIFEDMELESRNMFVGGVDENRERLYPARYVDGDNTYYGWVSKSEKLAYIPRDSSLGPQVLDKDFGVLIHRFLDRLCICPPCPPPSSRHPPPPDHIFQ